MAYILVPRANVCQYQLGDSQQGNSNQWNVMKFFECIFYTTVMKLPLCKYILLSK